jgi:hypothetical protein
MNAFHVILWCLGCLIVGAIAGYVLGNKFPWSKEKAAIGNDVKKIFPSIIIILVLSSSCTPNYNSPITGRLIAQQGHYVIMNDSVRNLLALGFVHLDSSHAGNPMVYDSVYRLQMTSYQKWKSNHKGYLIAAVLVAIIGFGSYIVITSSGGSSQSLVLIPILTILIGGGLMSGYYFFNPEREIKKSDYIQMSVLGSFKDWWQQPAQSY